MRLRAPSGGWRWGNRDGNQSGRRPERSCGASRTWRHVCTARGIKRRLGLSTDDAVGKAGSGCFPDHPATGYCQTLRVTERSPQKSVTGCRQVAAIRKFSPAPRWPACLVCVAAASDSDAIVNEKQSHYKGNFGVFLLAGYFPVRASFVRPMFCVWGSTRLNTRFVTCIRQSEADWCHEGCPSASPRCARWQWRTWQRRGILTGRRPLTHVAPLCGGQVISDR